MTQSGSWTRRARVARWWHVVTVAVIVGAVATQFVLTVQGQALVRAEEGGTDSTIERVVRFFSFFTIQSNILTAAVVATLALKPWRDGTVWRAVRCTSLLGITLTGIVYWTLLHGLVERSGIREVANYGVHLAAPALGCVGWLLFGPRPRVDLATLWWALAWPVGWLIYILILGEVTQWYPYPFVDVNEHGYGTVMLNVAVVAAIFIAFSWLLRWLDTRLRPVLAIEPG